MFVDGNGVSVLVIAPPGRLRDSLCVVLESNDGIGLVRKADDYSTAPCELGDLDTSLIVIDPQEDTESLGRTLRRLKAEWPGIPCLVVAHNQEQERQARAGGGDTVIQVGFSAETLFEAIADVLNRRIKVRHDLS